MPSVRTELHCPFDLTVSSMAALLNAELVDHPVYDGVELQRFDDATHGRGMLAAVITSTWQRTTTDRAGSYRRLTGS